MMNTMSPAVRHKHAVAFGLRSALFAATALAGCVFSIEAMASQTDAQQVLLAPLGSHRAPSAAVPVYAGVNAPAGNGADQGQNDPSPLAVPPELARPVSLAPDAAPPTQVAPAPSPVAASDLAAPDSAPAPAPAPIVEPAPAQAPSAPSPVSPPELAPTPPPRPRSTAARRVPVVDPGDAPNYPTAPSTPPTQPQTFAGRAQIPDEMRYHPRVAYAPDAYTPRSNPAVSTGVDDGPLLPAAAPVVAQTAAPAANTVVAANTPQGFTPYTPTGAAIPTSVSDFGGVSSDPVSRAIDRSILSLRQSLAPSIQVEPDYSGHNGQSGLSKLNSYYVPIEGTFSPYGVGQMKLTVTPITLSSGRLAGANSANAQTFGTMGLGLSNPFVQTTAPFTYFPPAYSGHPAGGQGATGTGLDLRYTVGYVSADIGSTPLGFLEQNIIGGLEIAPMITDHTRLRFDLDRRAVTETVLSYAGTTDPYSGRHWGGVIKTGGKLSVESSLGLWNVYVMGGGAEFTGTNVSNNADYEMATGATYPIYQYGKEELRTGVDLHYTSYDHNLRYFTYGQGGYFSPQRYLTALVPIIYKNQLNRDLSVEFDGGVGYQEFNDKKTPYYPTSYAQQLQLEAQTSGDPLLNAFYAPTKASGITGNIAGKLDYTVTPNFSVGARASFGNAGVYQSYSGGLYGRYTFNDWYAN